MFGRSEKSNGFKLKIENFAAVWFLSRKVSDPLERVKTGFELMLRMKWFQARPGRRRSRLLPLRQEWKWPSSSAQTMSQRSPSLRPSTRSRGSRAVDWTAPRNRQTPTPVDNQPIGKNREIKQSKNQSFPRKLKWSHHTHVVVESLTVTGQKLQLGLIHIVHTEEKKAYLNSPRCTHRKYAKSPKSNPPAPS